MSMMKGIREYDEGYEVSVEKIRAMKGSKKHAVRSIFWIENVCMAYAPFLKT